jgi:ribonucleoside-diphosphate reductase alpha chain
MDTLATMTSIALQYGVPLRDLVNKFAHSRFEPAGFTGNSEIPIAKSIVDYVFRWLGARFLTKDERDALGIISREDAAGLSGPSAPEAAAPLRRPVDANAPSDGSAAGSAETPRVSDAPAATSTAAGAQGAPSAQASTTTKASSIGEAGGPKASTASAEPPPAPAGDTDLPVLSSGQSNGHAADSKPIKPLELGGGAKVAFALSLDAPSCSDCGAIMIRNGSCYKCMNCGSTSGCS